AFGASVVVYVISMHTALKRVSPHNRAMQPWLVWLALIPILTVLWQFLIALGVCESLRSEFSDRDEDDDSDYGKSLGLGAAVLLVVNAVVLGYWLIEAPEILQAVFLHIVMLCTLCVNYALFFRFWVKIVGYSKRLLTRHPTDLERRLQDFDDADD